MIGKINTTLWGWLLLMVSAQALEPVSLGKMEAFLLEPEETSKNGAGFLALACLKEDEALFVISGTNRDEDAPVDAETVRFRLPKKFQTLEIYDDGGVNLEYITLNKKTA
jgi:hypothetical protein